MKDIDGIGAVSLVVAATGADFLLSDYETLIDDLDRVPRDTSSLIICDLGTDDSTRGEFIEKLAEFASRGCSVTYIDHHYMPARAKKMISKGGIRLVHDARECASMLTYVTFRDSLPSDAMKIALYGAVTDYMDTSPMGRRLMEKTDRHFILAESMLLSHAIARVDSESGFRRTVVKELSAMRLPHEIKRVADLALAQLRAETALAKEVKRIGRKEGRLAVVKTTENSTGNVAKLLIGAFDVPLGVSYRDKEDGWCEVSLRSTSELKIHLGKSISQIALRLGGNGGGHMKAAGCRVPRSKVKEMLRELAKQIGGSGTAPDRHDEVMP